MTAKLYALYQQDTLHLCKTLVIKDDQVAYTINRQLEAIGLGVDNDDPHSWKYYLNLSGRYHAFDTLMQVTSLDTLETIDFTCDMLDIHKTTRRAYAYGSSYFNTLVKQYPTQEQLIRRIVDPIDIDVAINAKNYQIIFYDQTRVESTEITLIDQLQQRIDQYFINHHVAAYQMADELYYAACLGILYLSLPQWVITLRLNNCHTPYVHSYHIWEYLSAHNNLDKYKDYLSQKQALFLYRNIRYIEMNMGKDDVFDVLIEKFLSDRGIALYQYDMRHNLTAMPTDTQASIEHIRTPVNFSLAMLNADDTFETQHILQKTKYLAVNNADVLDISEDLTDTRMKHSIRDIVPTKTLESEIIDERNALLHSLDDILMAHWVRWSAEGVYRAILTIDSPFLEDRYMVSAKDTLIAYLYCLSVMLKKPLTYVPNLDVQYTLRSVAPTLAQLRPTIPVDAMTDEAIDYIISRHQRVTTLTNPEDFFNACKAIFDDTKDARFVLGGSEDVVKHTYRRMVHDSLYERYHAVLGPETYSDWMRRTEMRLDELTVGDAALLAESLLYVATGGDFNIQQDLGGIQRAMLEIVQMLSTYDIQFIQTINAVGAIKTDWPVVRVGNVAGFNKDHQYLPHMVIGCLSDGFSGTHHAHLQQSVLPSLVDVDVVHNQHGYGVIDPTVSIFTTSHSGSRYRVPVSLVQFTVNEDNQ